MTDEPKSTTTITTTTTHVVPNLNGLIKLMLWLVCNIFVGLGIHELVNPGYGYLAMGIGFFVIGTMVSSE